MPEQNAKSIWAEAVEKVKDRTISPTLWRALEKAVGVVIEDGFFVVGFAPQDMPMSGHLFSSEHKNTIEAVIAELTGSQLRLRIMEGSSTADWENAKARQLAAEAARQVTLQRKMEESAASRTWDGVLEHVSRHYSSMTLRQLPQQRARYLSEAVVIISDALDVLYPSGSAVDERSERLLARVIERVATTIDLSAVEVADRLLRYRGDIK